jgi:hypothetical protein
MFCTAALAGRLQHSPGKSKIRKAVLMQVGPLVTLSNGTRLRALVTAPLLRFFPDSFVDFSVDDSADWVQSAIDRLLNTYPYPADEAEHHRLGWRDDDHIANCNRWAGIDGMMIRHENLSSEMLQNLGEVLGRTSTATWAQTLQYGFLERLTNSEGVNSYVTNDNIRDYFHFPVLFVHGEDNDVFHWLTSVRSHDLLLSVHGDDFPAFLEILSGYRHLDPLIGRNASDKVFRPIAGFLKEEHKVYPAFSSLTRSCYFRRPLVGPVLGWFRYNENTGTWWARVWCRLDDLRSPVSCAVVQVSSPGDVQWLHVDCPSSSKPGQPLKSLTVDAMDTVLCLDLDLGSEHRRYEICVLSAHEDLDQGRSAGRRNAGPSLGQRRNAELSLGKRMSTPTPHLSVEAGQSLRHKLHEPGEFEKWRARARGLQADQGEHLKIDHATVQVPEDSVTDRVTLALGSCRYPGWVFDRNRADEAFGALADLLRPAKPAAPDDIAPPSALFLVGDQIYADATAGVFDPKTRRERFYEAYREAWTAPHARRVLSQLPVYMMMDDHEAGDDWHPDDFMSKGDRRMRGHGLDAFRRYQWLHSPGNGGDRQDFWYDFTVQGFPVFVCDTRSERMGRKGILGPPQYDALTRWLEQQQIERGNRPKFVASPSVVVPFRGPLRDDNGTAEYPTRSDAWDGFPEQLVRLFTFIARNRIENVVFLCGDAHVSMDTHIWFEDSNGPQDLSIRCILAAPMYAPYPFVNTAPDEFVLDNEQSKLLLPDVGCMRYQVRIQSIAKRPGITVVSATRDSTGRWHIMSNVEPDFSRASVMLDVGVPADARIEFT